MGNSTNYQRCRRRNRRRRRDHRRRRDRRRDRRRRDRERARLDSDGNVSPNLQLIPPVDIWRYVMRSVPYYKMGESWAGCIPYDNESIPIYEKRLTSICKNPNFCFVHKLLFGGSHQRLRDSDMLKYQYIIDYALGTITPDEPTILQWQFVLGEDACYMNGSEPQMIKYFYRIREMMQKKESVPDEIIAQYQKIDLEQMIQDFEKEFARQVQASQKYQREWEQRHTQ